VRTHTAVSIIALAVAATAFRPWASAGAGPSSSASAAVAVQDSFPHAQHARLFTECDNCHGGINETDRAARFPSPELCAGCHNGDMMPRVAWSVHPPRPTPLHFDHAAHPEIGCNTCHATSDTAGFMQVGRADPDRCLQCHGGDAPSHLAQTSCEPCHGALPDAPSLAAADIARFPKPPSHDSSWVRNHPSAAAGGTCQVCHARQFCASCHPNAGAVAPIRALPADDRVAALVRGRRPQYPEPETHLRENWTLTHGTTAREGIATCANCHTRESCYACHLEPSRVQVVRALPRHERDAGPGVNLAGRRPPDHVPGFVNQHRTAAAGGDQRCARCHTPRFCTTCHDGPSAPTFHANNFLERHSQAAFNQQNECASCHQTQAFCLACHRQTGRSQPNAPRDTEYHNRVNGGNWLFGHSAPARRSIETCATCHEQRFCLQCHSPSQGWGVSPHGPGFNPDLGEKNPAMCRVCHLAGPPRQ